MCPVIVMKQNWISSINSLPIDFGSNKWQLMAEKIGIDILLIFLKDVMDNGSILVLENTCVLRYDPPIEKLLSIIIKFPFLITSNYSIKKWIIRTPQIQNTLENS